MPLNQLVSSVPTTRKDLRQRQYILVLIENEVTATLGRVRLSGIRVHHNTRVAAGTHYLDNRRIGSGDRSNYVTPSCQGGIRDRKGLRDLEFELIHDLSVARTHPNRQYAQREHDKFSDNCFHNFSSENGISWWMLC